MNQKYIFEVSYIQNYRGNPARVWSRLFTVEVPLDGNSKEDWERARQRAWCGLYYKLAQKTEKIMRDARSISQEIKCLGVEDAAQEEELS